MRAAKIIAIIIGVLLILVGLALLVPGSLLLWIDGQKDSGGYLSTSDRALSSTGYALVTPEVKLDLGSGDWIPGGGSVQISATPSGTAPVFIGIGPTDQVTAYLNGVAYDEVTNLGWFSSSVQYRHFEGGAPPASPGQQSFWVVQQEGTGTQTVRWDVQGGNWMAVVMNGDATSPVKASVSLGAHLGFLQPVGIGMTAAGVVLLAVGIVLVVLGARRSRQPLQLGYPGGPPYGPGQQPPYQQPPYEPSAPPPYQPPPYPHPYQTPPPGQQQPYEPPPYQAPPGQQPVGDVPPVPEQPQADQPEQPPPASS
jgi:uncharacterized membrane protein